MVDVTNAKLVAKGRIIAGSPLSPPNTNRVIDTLKAEGKVDPEVTPTGREWYSPTEVGVIWAVTGRIR